MPQEELPDFTQLHEEALKNGYESSGLDRDQPPSFTYNGTQLFEVQWIRMNQLGCSGTGRHTYSDHAPIKDKFERNTFALVDVTSKHGAGKGDVYARSVVKILGIYEDQRGCCYVAVHYFWRWGQIHASYDRNPATRPASAHQIFLQKEVLRKPMDIYGEMLRTPVIYEGSGKYVELISAVHLEMPSMVLHRQEAEQLPGGVQQYELKHGRQTSHWDQETDTPNNGFWFDSTFDQSAYLFEECDIHGQAVTADKLKRIPEHQLTMLDAFCGCGAVSVAANTVGFTVIGGIDSNADAISSYSANTMSINGCRFNAKGQIETKALHMSVENFVKSMQNGSLQLGPVRILHASPPCQNVSRKKKTANRVINGSETLAIADMVELLQPVYVTLEEVPGYVVQSFQKKNMVGPLQGWPASETPAIGSSVRATANTLQEPDESVAGLEDSDLSPDEDDFEEEEEEEVEEAGNTKDAEVISAPDSAPPAAAGLKSCKTASDIEEVSFSSIAMLVSRIVGMQYSVEVGILQAVDYQVPQQRERLVMLATKHGYQQARLPAPCCQRPPGYRQQPLPATDPNLCIRDKEPAEWRTMLEMAPDDDMQLPLYITIAEAIGDLPRLLASTSVGNALGRQVTRYDSLDPRAAVFRHPVPVDGLQGCEPLSRYSVYMRRPHTQHQSLRLGSVFNGDELRDHTCEHSVVSINRLLQIPEGRPSQGQPQETKEERAARVKAGRRRAGDYIAACVMGHNEPRKWCMHFFEDRWISILERRRLQSLPDWLRVEGDRKSREQQIGNAVPYLMGVAIMGEVFAAATGKQPHRPPVLLGPSLEVSGVPASALHSYQDWVQKVDSVEDQEDPQGGWYDTLQECRRLLSLKAASIRDQQQKQYQLLRQAQQQPQAQRPTEPQLQGQQQPGCSDQSNRQRLQSKRLQQPPLPRTMKKAKQGVMCPASFAPQAAALAASS